MNPFEFEFAHRDVEQYADYCNDEQYEPGIVNPMQEFFEAREYLRRVGDYRASRILCEGSEQRFAFVGITDRVVFLRIGETLVQLYRSERCRARVCRNDFFDGDTVYARCAYRKIEADIIAGRRNCYDLTALRNRLDRYPDTLAFGMVGIYFQAVGIVVLRLLQHKVQKIRLQFIQRSKAFGDVFDQLPSRIVGNKLG